MLPITVGHAYSIGTAECCLGLGDRGAMAVRDSLASRGLPPTQPKNVFVAGRFDAGASDDCGAGDCAATIDAQKTTSTTIRQEKRRGAVVREGHASGVPRAAVLQNVHIGATRCRTSGTEDAMREIKKSLYSIDVSDASRGVT